MHGFCLSKKICHRGHSKTSGKLNLLQQSLRVNDERFLDNSHLCIRPVSSIITDRVSNESLRNPTKCNATKESSSSNDKILNCQKSIHASSLESSLSIMQKCRLLINVTALLLAITIAAAGRSMASTDKTIHSKAAPGMGSKTARVRGRKRHVKETRRPLTAVLEPPFDISHILGGSSDLVQFRLTVMAAVMRLLLFLWHYWEITTRLRQLSEAVRYRLFLVCIFRLRQTSVALL